MDEQLLLTRLAEVPDDDETARRLEALYRSEQRWPDLAAHLVDRLEHTRDPEARQTLFEKASRIFDERLRDPGKALLVLLQAFGEQPDDARLARPLARLAERAGNWPDLLEAYEAALPALAPEARLPLLRRLAEWAAHLERADAAAGYLRALLALRPDDEKARRAYEEHLEARGDWRGLVAALRERLARERTAEGRSRLQQQIARVLEQKLGDAFEALRWLGELYARAPEDGLEMRVRRLAEQTGRFDELARIYEAALSAAPDPGRRFALAEIYAERLGDRQRAAEQYEHVVAEDPENLRAIRALRTLLEADERWEKLAVVLAREAALTDDRQERFQRWRALGDLYHERLNAPKEAVDAWFEALKARPDDKQVLVRLLEVYGTLRLWDASVKVLKKLIQLEDDPRRKAHFIYAMGVIQRDELKDHYKAVRTLDKALDLDPTHVKAFRAIDEILTADGDFERQDRYYRKMLVRAKEHRLDDDFVVEVARNLGEINRTRLGRLDAALQAYDIVLKRRPEDAQTLGLVAELHARAGNLTEAVRTLTRMLAHTPARADTYHQLYRLYRDGRQADAAWCVAQALVLLNRADDEARKLYERGRDQQGGQLRRSLEAADWPLLTAGKSEALDAVMLRLFPLVGPQLTVRHKDLGLNPKKDRIDLAAPSTFTRVLAYAADAAGIPAPEAWYLAGAMGLNAANLSPPGLIVGADMAERPVAELAFLCGRQLYLSGRQHLLATLDYELDARQRRLGGILSTLARHLDPAAPVSFVDPAVQKALTALGPADAGVLARAMAVLSQQPDFGLPAWLEALDDTANRLGLLLCGDLAVAARLVHGDPRPLGGGPPDARVGRLLVFAVSPQYVELRRRLGTALRA